MSVALPFTPVRVRLSANPNASASSPHYPTARRHSLYGTEDRIILDPGSRVWKVGFSGEGKPRVILCVAPKGSLKRSDKREEEEKMLEHRTQDRLRSVFSDSLLTDPKLRKVIVVEHPLMPLHVEEKLARILFRNIQVPSLSFAPSHLLALLASDCMTGLVLDRGHPESTVLPVENQSGDDDGAKSLDVPPSSETNMAASDAEPPSDVFSSAVPISEAQAAALEVERARAMYSRHTDATNLHFRVMPPGIVSHTPGASTRGTLLLFEGGDVGKSVAEVILDALLKVPVDLRKDFVSSILVVGGTAMLPGFIPRFSPFSIRRPRYDPYAPLRPLAPFISILNNPVPPLTASSTLAGANAGKAPAFAPAILPWVGGSLAGTLTVKTGGEEILRERWGEVLEESLEPPLSPLPAAIGQQDGSSGRRTGMRYVDILPDWTRIPLGVGAPSVALNLSSALPPGTPI
ncbi:hypothetical protein BOTBODRAFT_30843 [Botryobasidium botryosum FD-172 SS1]|uniref:Actin-like ATPase domain-containing protein n=1 Tax=Botryobasidium botryosum (strain FD-172 SS1) TaxID=930990 RepID=A0A067MLT4_BOTB1|nr:hypothetical protein BOTBODRAFT_30843 [Botryobasidium botryosum FD-172 SS1]